MQRLLITIPLFVFGLPGCGKSWAARHLARPFEAVLIRSDVVRKRLAGIPATHHPTGPAEKALYSSDLNRRTYQTMLEEAAKALSARRPVVVDATFPRSDSRGRFVDLARSAGAPYAVVYLDCPEALIANRLRDRAGAPHEVSDADWEVYRQFKARFEPPREFPAEHARSRDVG